MNFFKTLFLLPIPYLINPSIDMLYNIAYFTYIKKLHLIRLYLVFKDESFIKNQMCPKINEVNN